MRYQKYAPGKNLAPYVECYYAWDRENPLEEPLVIETPPSGYAAFVFNLGDPYYSRQHGKDWQPVPQVFISGQMTRTYALQLTGHVEMFGVVFKPASPYDLLGVEMSEWVGQRVDARQLLGPEVKELFGNIQACHIDSGRVQLLETYLSDQLVRRDPIWDEVNDALELILEQNGLVSHSELYARYQLSPRQFQRNFRKKVGLSPKNYTKLKRFSHICYLLVTQKKIDWHEVVHLGGYYDQSHFIKDFLAYMEENPSTYYQTHQELIRHLEK